MAGSLSFFLVPYAAAALGASRSTELDFDTLGLVAVVIAIGVPLLNMVTLWTVPDGDLRLADGPSSSSMSTSASRASWRASW